MNMNDWRQNRTLFTCDSPVAFAMIFFRAYFLLRAFGISQTYDGHEWTINDEHSKWNIQTMKYLFIYSFIFLLWNLSGYRQVCRFCECEWTPKTFASQDCWQYNDECRPPPLIQSIDWNVWLEQHFLFFFFAIVATSEHMCDCAIVTFDKCLADTFIQPWIILSMQTWHYQS